MGVCPSICHLIGNYLSSRSSTISFGDFESAPKNLSIGLPQGSPLSVILSIIYNSSLMEKSLDIPDTISLGFIDDVAFETAAHTTEEVAEKLQVLASRELRWGKQHGAAFDMYLLPLLPLHPFFPAALLVFVHLLSVWVTLVVLHLHM